MTRKDPDPMTIDPTGELELAAELDAYLADEEPSGALTDERAAAMVRAVARRRRTIAAAQRVAMVEHARIDEWLEEVHRRNSTADLEASLAIYHAHRLELDPRAKTVPFPAGDLVARQRPAAWAFDDDAFLAWAREHRPELVRTKVEVDRSAAKRALSPTSAGVLDNATGELVPGVEVTDGGVAYTVRSAGGF